MVEQRAQLTVKDAYIRDLEDYIDNLLVKVMETQPRLLQNPYVQQPTSCGTANVGSGTNRTPTPLAPPSATLSPGVYLANSRNRDLTTTFTGIVTHSVKSSKTSRRSANGNPLKFIQSLISTKQ